MTSSAFACASCERPVTLVDEVIVERYGSTLNSHVFAYELEVLDKDVWCYSATNPNDDRFDVCRFGTVNGVHVRVHGSPTAEHSWFPPYLWRMASCPTCAAHLGWAFVEVDGDAKPVFIGLILTRLKQISLPVGQFEEAARSADMRQQQRLSSARAVLTAAMSAVVARVTGREEGIEAPGVEDAVRTLVEHEGRVENGALEWELEVLARRMQAERHDEEEAGERAGGGDEEAGSAGEEAAGELEASSDAGMGVEEEVAVVEQVAVVGEVIGGEEVGHLDGAVDGTVG